MARDSKVNGHKNKGDIIGKRKRFGGSRKHRKGSSGSGGVWAFKAQRTLRNWKVNSRKVKVVKAGVVETLKMSMKAYKKLRKGGSIDGYTLYISDKQRAAMAQN